MTDRADAPYLDDVDAMLVGRTLVAFEEAQEGVLDNGLHHHKAGQLLGSARGLLSVVSDGGHWVVPATHCVWLPPGQVHAVRSHGPFSGWSIYADAATCAGLWDSPRTMRTTGLLREAMHKLAALPAEPPFVQHERLAAVIIDEIAELPAEQLGLAMPVDSRLLKIANALIADVADDRSLEAWAAWATIPSRTVSRRFVAETGFTFTAWRQRARLLRALELLAQGQAVTTVSLDLGYDNVGGFIALFRRTYGVTPRDYARLTGARS